uniref:Formin-like protein n=1 Tax=Mucochytrium quahogii TaxID=96639 RepID=A0A7S2RJU4_9STRA|mmetsp:Transcript_28205/g.45345  ORF Transcript_28205/g.45345 Transcript_28205/m.45345 type:complete len:985 (+) Transcript_28205:1431-4385(+)
MAEVDACLCCNADFVAFEKKYNCSKCGNTVCEKCSQRQKSEHDKENTDIVQDVVVVCKDCEFMGKWVNDVKEKDEGKFWRIKMPKRMFRRRKSSHNEKSKEKMPKELNKKFSVVSSMLDRKSPRPSANTLAIIPTDIQENLQALSREKLKEIHDQKKMITELQEENERIRNGAVDQDQLTHMKTLIDELKRESEMHISALQQRVDDLSAENLALKTSGSQEPEDPKLAKYRKMQKAKLPEGAIMQAAARDGVELPADFFTAPVPQTSPPPVPVEDPKFAKYRKMQKAKLPEGAIMQAAARDGVELPQDFFTAPPPTATAVVPVVEEDPKFAKYRKMQKAKLPEGAVMQAAARDGVELPADFFVAPAPQTSPPPVPTEDPKFGKYRKMQRAKLPDGAIMQAAARDGVTLPGNFFTEPVESKTPPIAVPEDPKLAKYRKMQKAKLPQGAIIQAAARDGVELPATFFQSDTGTMASIPAAGGGLKPAIAAAPEKPKSKYETKRCELRKVSGKKLRGVFWNVLPASRVENTFWCNLPDQPPFRIDTHLSTLEKCFAKTEGKKLELKGGGVQAKSSVNGRQPFLDAKRQQNLGIAIARFKEPVSDLKKYILSLDQNFFTMEVVHKLISMAPTPEEIQAVSASQGEWSGPGPFTEGMSRVEHFVYEMSTIPRLRQRLQCVFVEMSFERQSESLQESLAKYEKGCVQLKTSKEWQQLLHLVLTAGNYLNTGNKSTGGAWGFEVSTGLQKLSQSKAAGNSKYSLLHWVAEVAEQKAPQLFTITEKLDMLEEASAMKLEDLKTDLAQLSKGCDLVERELKACSGATFGTPSDAPGSKEFIKMMKPFLQEHGQPVIEQIKRQMGKIEELASGLLSLHGEVSTKCSASQLLATAVLFCKSLVKARDENVLNRLVDEKKSKNTTGPTLAREGASKALAPALAAKSKQLDKQLKTDKLNKKLKNSFSKKSTKTSNSMQALVRMQEKLGKGNKAIQSA